MRRQRPVTSYSGAHANVRLHRGRALEYQCKCGEVAAEWAYRHGSVHEQRDGRGLAFSVYPGDYEPMCRVWSSTTSVRNKACVNPEHLRELTSGENIRRAYRHLDESTLEKRERNRIATAKYRAKRKGGGEHPVV